MWYVSKRRQLFCSNTHKLVFYELIYDNYITVLPFSIEMIQYDWLWSGHTIIKEMFYIPINSNPNLHVPPWRRQM
jgi:hypothetical protein